MNAREPAPATRALNWRDTALLIYGGVLVIVSWVIFVWLMWKFVPIQSAVLEGAGVTPTASARLVIRASAWFVRLIPLAMAFVCLLVPIAIASAFALAAGGRVSWARIVRGLTAVLLILGLFGVLADAAVVAAMQLAYQHAISERQAAPSPTP